MEDRGSMERRRTALRQTLKKLEASKSPLGPTEERVANIRVWIADLDRQIAEADNA